MNRRMVAFSISFGAMLGGCDYAPGNQRLSILAETLERTSVQCLAEVRDQHLRYESAPSCVGLGPIAHEYISAGGYRSTTPPKYEVRFERARANAWAARATSATGGGSITIW
jgi:hypothetical protein